MNADWLSETQIRVYDYSVCTPNINGPLDGGPQYKYSHAYRYYLWFTMVSRMGLCFYLL